ncbi:MAG: hypothetical protein IT242_09700 [Bacteroidia bacterium]|nr:hypothetical protein [Bacteroidia bacterium]
MKKKVQLTIAICLAAAGLRAQVVSGIKPLPEGKMGEFTEWKKQEITFEDKSTASIEYRVALVARKGIGCHYDLEVKNTSDQKLNVRLKSNYYDKLVKSYFGDEIKETLKPGKTVSGRFVGQGCRKEKGVERDDYGHCIACDFSLSIFVEK